MSSWLLSTSQGGSQDPALGLWGAAIGLGGVVIGSLIAALTTAHRERVARREQSQREALYELQESAFAMQQALEGFGKALEAYEEAGHEVPDAVTTKLDDARGQLQMIKYRIICDTVRDRVDAWVNVAEPFYTGDQTLIVTQVDTAWDALQIDIGRELRRLA